MTVADMLTLLDNNVIVRILVKDIEEEIELHQSVTRKIVKVIPRAENYITLIVE